MPHRNIPRDQSFRHHILLQSCGKGQWSDRNGYRFRWLQSEQLQFYTLNYKKYTLKQTGI